jgi:hypothetical protein
MQFYAKEEIDVQEGESELKVGKTEDVRARAQYFLLAGPMVQASLIGQASQLLIENKI